ncbi:hypothetical protein VTN02DRAFT_3674 [Thermoascus thermophilus]
MDDKAPEARVFVRRAPSSARLAYAVRPEKQVILQIASSIVSLLARAVSGPLCVNETILEISSLLQTLSAQTYSLPSPHPANTLAPAQLI